MWRVNVRVVSLRLIVGGEAVCLLRAYGHDRFEPADCWFVRVESRWSGLGGGDFRRSALAARTGDSCRLVEGGGYARRSARVYLIAPSVRRVNAPTVWHVVVDGHATSLSRLLTEPVGLGLGMSDQFAPSQCSIKVASPESPTA